MDFLALTQRLHREAKRSTAAPTSVVGATDRNASLFERVSSAWMDIQRERDWKWMRQVLDKPLTPNVQTYTGAALGATRFGRWRKADHEYSPWLYISGAPNSLFMLGYWQLDEFRFHYIYRQVGPTIPVAWSYDDFQNLLIGPAPLAAYQLRIDQWMEPFELANDTDTPDMPDRFHLMIMWQALMDVAREDATPEIFDKAVSNYTSMREQLLRDQARLPT